MYVLICLKEMMSVTDTKKNFCSEIRGIQDNKTRIQKCTNRFTSSGWAKQVCEEANSCHVYKASQIPATTKLLRKTLLTQ